jgi:Kdo2-lipid IVA lauroyltransferase/acyltransferase
VEIRAGFVEFTDHEIRRLIESVREIGELDNTPTSPRILVNSGTWHPPCRAARPQIPFPGHLYFKDALSRELSCAFEIRRLTLSLVAPSNPAMSFWTHRPHHIAEYVALRLVGGVMRALPYRRALDVGWGIAVVGFFVVRWRRAEAERRIRAVFGERYSPAEVRSIAWHSLRDFIFSAVETLRLPGITLAWIEAHTDYADVQKIRASAAGKGAILVIPHMGSWELAGVAVQKFELPLFFIVGHQKNPLTDAYIDEMRGTTGIERIPRDSSALRGAIKRLKEGKILAFMTDLRSKTPGVKVQFLGNEANVVAGMGMFARMTGLPIIPAVVTRRGLDHHLLAVHDSISPDAALDRDDDIRRMTQYVMNIFDAAVRSDPGQYFWYNKRWILDPLEPDAAATRPAPSN